MEPQNAILPLLALGIGILHLVFMAGVWADADRLKNSGQKLWFAGPIIWALGVLLGGILMALAYWLMHHSTLRPVPPIETKPVASEPPSAEGTSSSS